MMRRKHVYVLLLKALLLFIVHYDNDWLCFSFLSFWHFSFV